MRRLSATGLQSSEVLASVGVLVEAVRNRVAHAVIALSAVSTLGADITAVRLGLIEPPPCRM
jgi:hypothetical protein